MLPDRVLARKICETLRVSRRGRQAGIAACVSTSRLLLMATAWRNDSVHPQIENQLPVVIHGVPQLASRDDAFRLVGNLGYEGVQWLRFPIEVIKAGCSPSCALSADTLLVPLCGAQPAK
jgi:hypothetical protein